MYTHKYVYIYIHIFIHEHTRTHIFRYLVGQQNKQESFKLAMLYVLLMMLVIATHCNTLQHTATHCNTLQHTVTHCNTLQHTATHCNTLQQQMGTSQVGDALCSVDDVCNVCFYIHMRVCVCVCVCGSVRVCV